MSKKTCYFDGSCTPINPDGNMGWGAIVKDETGKNLYEFSGSKEAAPGNTNNVAEYMALAAVLNHLFESRYIDEEILIKGDSQLVIQQMSGKWKIKRGAYKETAESCFENIQYLKNERGLKISFEWIPREQNGEADLLSNPQKIEFVKPTSFKKIV